MQLKSILKRKNDIKSPKI